jgi:hypothetical protein
MPAPVVEPSPFTPAERFGAPEEAQETSYFAASASTPSLVASAGSMRAPFNVHGMFQFVDKSNYNGSNLASLPIRTALSFFAHCGLELAVDCGQKTRD